MTLGVVSTLVADEVDDSGGVDTGGRYGSPISDDGSLPSVVSTHGYPCLYPEPHVVLDRSERVKRRIEVGNIGKGPVRPVSDPTSPPTLKL